MQDSKSTLGFLVEVAIEPRQFQAKYPYQLLSRKTWVDHGSKHVEKSLHPKFLSDGCHTFHGRVKKWRMQKTEAYLIQTSSKLIGV